MNTVFIVLVAAAVGAAIDALIRWCWRVASPDLRAELRLALVHLNNQYHDATADRDAARAEVARIKQRLAEIRDQIGDVAE